MQEINYDLLLNRLQTELTSLRETLDFDEKSLSKKELQRSVKNLRGLVIATLEHPLDKTQDLSEEMLKLLDKTIGIRMTQTALTMFAVSDKELDESEKQVLEEAEARTAPEVSSGEEKSDDR